ncbi:hypothetical protein WBP06_18955 [Novosphingobium sp. BL-8H]|uniref:hypothetical protein n=1 Tax=Novosphingobium sp. BL-8H TaxID=3127640 RepID=UPI0037581DEF
MLDASGVVTCSGFVNGGYSSSNVDAIEEIEAGATLNGPLQALGSGDVLIHNAGSIQNFPDAVTLDGTAGFTKTLNNDGVINGNLIGAGAGRIVFYQNGNMNGSVQINGTGINDISIGSGRSIQSVNIVGSDNSLDNSGVINGQLLLNGTSANFVVNRSVLNAVEIDGDGQNTLFNVATINGNVNFNSNGNVFVQNTGLISNSIRSTGASADFIDNAGNISGAVDTGDGNDVVINRVGSVNTLLGPQRGISTGVNTGNGNDVFMMLGGEINGNVMLGAGQDFAVMSGGTLTNPLQTQDGNDLLYWSGGTMNAIDMGNDDDTALFFQLTPSNMANNMFDRRWPG